MAKSKSATNPPTRRGGPNEKKTAAGKATAKRADAKAAVDDAFATKKSKKADAALATKKSKKADAPKADKAPKAEKASKADKKDKKPKADKIAAKAEKAAAKADKKAEKAAAKKDKKAEKAAAKKDKKQKKLPVVPKGYATITAVLNQTDAAATIDFCEKVFDANTRLRNELPNGKIIHSEVEIGDSVIMISDAVNDPARVSAFYVYVKDVDKTIARAHHHGASLKTPITNQFWGVRSGTITDPAGNVWTIATVLEDLSSKELEKRAAEAFGRAGAGNEGGGED